MKYLKQIIQSVVFLTILCTLLYGINQVLYPKYTYKNTTWPTTTTYTQFYDMDENSVDVLFLGSSVVINAYSPQELYNNYGIRSYNLGSDSQSLFLSYYWLKEALRTQSPQAVVLEVRFLYTEHPECVVNTPESYLRKALDPMRFGPVKREAVSELCNLDTTQSELSYYLTNIRFHSRWASLEEQDISFSEGLRAPLKGYYPLSEYGPSKFDTYKPADSDILGSPNPIMLDYLNRTVELCHANNIDLILVNLPGDPMNDGIANYIKGYALEKDLTYYNFCEETMYRSLKAKLPRESTLSHANYWGSLKTTEQIGKTLSEQFAVEGIKDAQYEETKEFYDHVKESVELSHIEDMGQYLDAINDNEYTIFMSVKYDYSKEIAPEIRTKLNVMGLKFPVEGQQFASYLAIVSPEHGTSEYVDGRAIMKSGSIRNGKTFYEVKSAGYYAGFDSVIKIDGEDYSLNATGLNVVVYDSELMKVVDSRVFEP